MKNKVLIVIASLLFAVIIGLIMQIALWADDIAYKEAINTNSIKLYKEFLDQYPNSKYLADIQGRYDECAYRLALKEGTKKAYQEFLNEHPNSEYIDSVKLFLEEIAYKNAISSNDISYCCDFIKDYPNSEHIPSVLNRLDYLEEQFYRDNINIPVERVNRNLLSQYNHWFPNGKYNRQVLAKLDERNDYDDFLSAKGADTKDGWEYYLQCHPNGMYASRARAKIKEHIEREDYNDYLSAKRTDTRSAWQDYINKRPKGKYVSTARARIQEYEEREYYLNYSLSNGSQPYASTYGYNSSCDTWGCSQIKVSAPSSSDVLVLIKRNNSRGRVARHAYIRAGYSYTFEVPNGVYQVFFYYGTGWYPKKLMEGGIRGGFLKDEVFSKDDPVSVSNNILTYSLQLQRNGNFSTKMSNESEMF